MIIFEEEPRLMNKKRVMAIMRNVRFGIYTDTNFVSLSFTAFTSENIGSLQVLNVETGIALIKAYKVEDIRDLEGKTVWVTTDEMRTNYDSPCVIIGK